MVAMVVVDAAVWGWDVADAGVTAGVAMSGSVLSAPSRPSIVVVVVMVVTEG